MKISLNTLSDAGCGVGDLEIFSVYPRLFGTFFSSFSSLPECRKYKPSITQLSCLHKAWFLLRYFGQSILLLWLIFTDVKFPIMWNHMLMIDQKKWFVFKLRKKNWFNYRFLYFFINGHAKIEKLTAKINLITWNA